MKNIVSKISFLLLFIVGFICLSSCEDEFSASKLEGTWEDNTRVLQIGESSWHTYCKNGYRQDRRGTYTYDKKSRTIFVSIQAVPGNNSAYTEKFFVQTLNSTTLSLMDMDDGSTYIYKRK